MFRCPSNGNGNGYGYGQQHSTTNYHRTHSGEHVTKVAQRPGVVLQHHVVHKESFKEVDGGKAPAANNRRCFDNYPMKANNAMAVNHHGGGSHHRYEAYEETYEESSCEEETYAYGAGRHHGHGGGGRRFEYETHEETYEEEEEEAVVGGDGCAQLRRPYCRP